MRSIPDEPLADRYRAAAALIARRRDLVHRANVEPQWIGDGSSFWYRVSTADGPEWVIAEPEAGVRRVVAPIPDGVGATEPTELRSPDGHAAVFLRDHDLWIRTDGAEYPLTGDGSVDEPYARMPDAYVPRGVLGRAFDGAAPPVALWSPDSSRILTHRIDQRDVPFVAVQGDAARSIRFATPGTPVTSGRWVILDARNHAPTPTDAPDFVIDFRSPILVGEAWWSPDSRTVYALQRSRDGRRVSLLAIDAESGGSRVLVREESATRIDFAPRRGIPPVVRVLDDGHRVLWYSQRDGRGRLYLVDGRGGEPDLLLTPGPGIVDGFVHVDEQRRIVHLTMAGLDDEDPYRRALVSVPLSGGPLTRLTPMGFDCTAVAAPHGRWFVVAASRPDAAPVSSVVSTDGSVLLELERADPTPLTALGWTPPLRVRTVAADGRTELFGLLYRPAGLRRGERAPLIDHLYPGPQVARTSPGFEQGPLGHQAEALARLGFGVLALDGRGTPGRDKAFHDVSYGDLGYTSALGDHAAAIPQLAVEHPWIDTARVSAVGYSAGGFAAVRAMALHPEVFSCAVAISGNHDNRRYHATWAERYHGTGDEAVAADLANASVADRIRGPVLLLHGGADENVMPHHSIELARVLEQFGVDVELVVIPGADHDLLGREISFATRVWDFLVRAHFGERPPELDLVDEAVARADLLVAVRTVYRLAPDPAHAPRRTP